MPSFQLLAIDIDGTLINSRSELTPPTRAAVRRAADAGIRVVLATGRRYSQTLPLVEPIFAPVRESTAADAAPANHQLPTTHDSIEIPLVTASGGLVKDARDHRTLFCAAFAAGTLAAALQLLQRRDYDALLCADSFHEGFDFYYPRRRVARSELQDYLDKNPTAGRHCPDMAQRPPPGIFASFTMGSFQQMQWVEAQLTAALPGQLQTHVVRSPRYHGAMCEILPAGVSKWTAVRRLARQWSIPDAAICAVGDDANDLAMIRAAGLGVAMGNASPAVKAAADLVVPTHDEDGLVHLVDHLLR